MTDPRDGTGDEEPSYDWLYPTPTHGVGENNAPEETRILPPGSAVGKPQPSPSSVATAPGGPTGPSRGQQARRWLKRLLWIVPILALLWVGYLVVVPVLALRTIDRVDATPVGKRPAEQPGTTYLLVGSDARKGLAGQRTDTIMLLHTGEGPNLLMSIPRDSLVDIPGHGTNKINAAFAYGGPSLLVRTIETDTGIRIDDYVEIGFSGFKEIIDALGGIEICPKTRMVDPLAHLKIKKGCQVVDGKTALGYARSRHTSALGDIDRAQRQREVVSTAAHDAVSWSTFLNPVKYYRLNFAAADSFTLGDDTSALAAARLAWALTHVDASNGLTCAVPITDLAVHWDRDRANRLFKLIREDRTADIPKSLCRKSGLPK